jgi:nitric oxide reductase NorQ protein
MLVVSFNPGYQNIIKSLKPSTRQRFVAMSFDFPPPDLEIDIIAAESGLPPEKCKTLVRIANRLRALKGQDIEEGASTRLVVYCASLIAAGMSTEQAVRVALIEPLSDDEDVKQGLADVIQAVLG